MKSQKGFTLVEISIVLVIIGLILAGLFVNSDVLIGNTKATSTAKLIQDLSGAVSDFKNRYHYLPGDLPNATQDIAGIAVGDPCNIAPNGTIGDGEINSLVVPSESTCAVQELVLAGFVKGDANAIGFISALNPTTTPDVYLKRTAESQVNINLPAVNRFPATVQNIIEVGTAAVGISCDAANAIDNKLDDGNPLTGNVRRTNCNNGVQVLDVGL
jgi:prepilin-type N-terminal cleavage/methylation domain-containing protein